MIDIETSDFNGAIIKVIGVGGAGNNAVDRMLTEDVGSIEFIAANTDKQVLDRSNAKIRIQLGEKLTRGRGAGGRPEIGKKAAEETRDEIAKAISGSDMLFITAGMGGGTGTGAAPVIAEIAKEIGILTVGVVTKPFDFEKGHRMKYALEGISELKKNVDTLVVIPNQKLLEVCDKEITAIEALKLADQALQEGVLGISNLISKPGTINLDFADVRTIMSDKGLAHMGVGRASGKNKIQVAAELAINSPLLETSIAGAKSVLVSVAGDNKLGLFEMNAAADIVSAAVDPNAEFIFGTSMSDELNDEIVVTVIATNLGIDSNEQISPSASAVHPTVTKSISQDSYKQIIKPLDDPPIRERDRERERDRPRLDRIEIDPDLPFDIPKFLQKKKT